MSLLSLMSAGYHRAPNGQYEYLRPLVNVPLQENSVPLQYNPATGLHDGHVFDTTWVTRAYLLTATTVVTVKASGGTYTPAQFQTALNDAGTANDFRVIVVDSGLTINTTSGFTMPSKTGTRNWTFVVCSNWWSGTWAPSGSRYINCDTEASNLFTVQPTAATVPGFIASTVNHSCFGIIGGYLKRQTVNTAQEGRSSIEINNGSSTAISDLPFNHFVQWSWIDGVWEQGGVNYPTLRGVVAYGHKFAFRNSVASGFGAAADNQAILASGGAGRIQCEDSLLEAGSENFMCGGGPPNANYPVTDMLFRRCYFVKRQNWNPASSLFNAGYVSASPKNSFELKHGIRVLVEACVMQNSYSVGGQQAVGAVIKCANQTNVTNAQETTDVCIRLCKQIGVGQQFAVSMLEYGSGNSNDALTKPVQRCEFTGNLSISAPVSQIEVGGTNTKIAAFYTSGTARPGKVYGPIFFRFNTGGSLDPVGLRYRTMFFGSNVLATQGSGTQSFIRDNVFDFPGDLGVNNDADGTISAQAIANAGYDVDRNAIVESPVGAWLRQTDFNSLFPSQSASKWWTTNASSTRPTTARPTGRFTDWANGDWSVASGATWKGQSVGGNDPGYNRPLLESVTAGVANPPSFIPVTFV